MPKIVVEEKDRSVEPLWSFIKGNIGNGFVVHRHSMLDYGEYYYIENNQGLCLIGNRIGDRKILGGIASSYVIEVYDPEITRLVERLATKYERRYPGEEEITIKIFKKE